MSASTSYRQLVAPGFGLFDQPRRRFAEEKEAVEQYRLVLIPWASLGDILGAALTGGDDK